MVWKQEYNIDLRNHSTMQIGGVGKNLITIDNPAHDLIEIFESIIPEKSPIHILGEGSNSIFAGDFPHHYFLKLNNKDISIFEQNEESVVLRVGGGVAWDDLVQYATDQNLHGIEMMSAIPGTVAAAPVQNIGAYGGEFNDVCHSVEVFNIENKKCHILQKEDCDFSYRSSIFKKHPGRYIVYTIYIRLYKKATVDIPQYPGVYEYLEEKNITNPNIKDIRTAITSIRWGKLPKPSELANCGSFFKNTLITEERCKVLLQTYPDMKCFPAENGMVKISTGWLIDSQNLKGHRVGDMGIYEKHALVIVNYGKGTYGELIELLFDVIKRINDAFGIIIEPEVNIIAPLV